MDFGIPCQSPLCRRSNNRRYDLNSDPNISMAFRFLKANLERAGSSFIPHPPAVFGITRFVFYYGY